MPQIREGCMVIADIGGYTRYLKSVELEHAHDVLSDLLAAVSGVVGSALEVAKLEGDAVFAVDRRGVVDGNGLVALIEATYFAFATRRREIDRRTSCACRACGAIGDLDLKFVAHHGEFLAHKVGRHKEVMGPDVVLVHRLLKNTVTRRTGLTAYALLTTACVESGGLDAATLGLAPFRVSGKDVGRLEAWVLDLGRRWEEEQLRTEVRVDDTAARITETITVPALPAQVWDVLVSPEDRPRWNPDLVSTTQENPGGTRGVGTVTHCVHGKGMELDHVIVDWKPFDYYTEEVRTPFGRVLQTWELTPGDDGSTRVEYRVQPIGAKSRLLGPFGFRVMRREVKKACANLADYIKRQPPAGR